MKSHTETPGTNEGLVFSHTERDKLKGLIMEKIQSLDPNSSLSVGLFFNTIEITLIGEFKDLAPMIIQNWNRWIQLEKSVCIESSRSNAIKMPKIRFEMFQIFLNILMDMGLLDRTNATVSRINMRVQELISPNKS